MEGPLAAAAAAATNLLGVPLLLPCRERWANEEKEEKGMWHNIQRLLSHCIGFFLLSFLSFFQRDLFSFSSSSSSSSFPRFERGGKGREKRFNLYFVSKQFFTKWVPNSFQFAAALLLLRSAARTHTHTDKTSTTSSSSLSFFLYFLLLSTTTF